MNLFYAADIKGQFYSLSTEESKHTIRVLRMKSGDTVFFTDGRGSFFECIIVNDNPKACEIEILSKKQGVDKRTFHLQMAVAPTKNITRYEWFLEKATEIGIDSITPIISSHSERKVIKVDRLKRVITAAMKQSLKSFHPKLEEALAFADLVKKPFEGQKFIAYIDKDVTLELSKAYRSGQNALILIGPEGDFSPDEVKLAKQYGFVPVRLGPSRLRTETAAVVACHTVNLLNL